MVVVRLLCRVRLLMVHTLDGSSRAPMLGIARRILRLELADVCLR